MRSVFLLDKTLLILQIDSNFTKFGEKAMTDAQKHKKVDRITRISLAVGLFLGLAVCLGIGYAIGSWTGKMDMWLGLGIPFGLVFGLVFAGGISELVEKWQRKQNK